MATDLLLTAMRAHLELPPTHRVPLEPLKKGASGRTIVRLKPEGLKHYIGIHYTDERADNENFYPVAQHLKRCGINVPEVVLHAPLKKMIITEDLGGVDLHSLHDQPFKDRLPSYRIALEQLDKLFYARKPKDFELQPKFDAAMYRWEQDYFTDHFVEGYWGKGGAPVRASQALYDLAEGLGKSARHMVHRDFQSQNIMLHENKAYLIDFQGLRLGRQEYDIASFLYDPYMNHSADEREQLLDLWEEISEERPIEAIGAFSNIILNQRNDWYKTYLPIAAASLKEITKGTEYQDVLHPYLDVPDA